MGYEFPFLFFSVFLGRFISDFHFLLLNEAHSARQTENQKGVWIGRGCDFLERINDFLL